jgi:hypothetical protein
MPPQYLISLSERIGPGIRLLTFDRSDYRSCGPSNDSKNLHLVLAKQRASVSISDQLTEARYCFPIVSDVRDAIVSGRFLNVSS